MGRGPATISAASRYATGLGHSRELAFSPCWRTPTLPCWDAVAHAHPLNLCTVGGDGVLVFEALARAMGDLATFLALDDGIGQRIIQLIERRRAGRGLWGSGRLGLR